MKVNSRFVNVIQFRRALNHYALINEFEYLIEKSEPTRVTARCANLKCKWNIHAYIMDDNVTFEVKKLVEEHSCIRSNKGGNRRATQGWIANVVSDKLKSDGDVSVTQLRKWLMKHYKRAGNVAYGILESENTSSWIWFLELLKKAIGTPHGLVISSDMQKGLEVAITQVYPDAEHRECLRHLYSNFKKKFRGDFYNIKLWGAAKTYSVNVHDRLLNDIAGVSEKAITYLHANHNKVWSRCKFGTTSKCDYITNNLSESFNSWVGDLRYQPVLNLLDGIREMLMARFDKKRRVVRKWKGTLVPAAKTYLKNISKNLGEYAICRSSDNRAEVKHKGKRWEVVLDEKKCTCRVWQVKGLPCVHAVAFIAFIRDSSWDKYVDPYFTIQKFKETYALEIAPLPTMDHWVPRESGEKIFPPVFKRPIGRPRKNRIVAHDESKRKNRCPRCLKTGHHAKNCKNPAPIPSKGFEESEASTSKSQRIKGQQRSTSAERHQLDKEASRHEIDNSRSKPAATKEPEV
ncbi:transposase, MuDR, MULE transposase domain protein [Tanacetum coccineum]